MNEESEQDAGEDPPDGLGRLREIIFREDRRELRALRDRVDSFEVTAEDVGRVLPDAVRERDDDRLGRALAPTIEDAIHTSVQRNPRALADAIYPVIGPAIRTAIRQALAGLVAGINRTLEHSLSPRGIRWRLEAYRSGRPFAEVVLKHSVVFRVEQVLLIHRETSLLLDHVTAPEVGVQDPELVSSMLGAIQDFVIDSFGEGRPEGIAQIEFGEDVLEVAQGPRATVVCVVRGVAPPSLRGWIEEALENVHRELATELSDFDGDVSPCLPARPTLETLLVEEQAPTTERKPFGKAVLGAAVVALVLLGTIAFVRRWSNSSRWERAVASLAIEPGIVIASSSRAGSGGVVVGLRDPLSRDPDGLFREVGVDPDDVAARWGVFHSLEPELVERRARAFLEPPPTVQLTLEGERLVLTGDTPHAWLVRARTAASTIPGVSSADLSGLVDVDLRNALGDARDLEGHGIPFSAGSDTVEPAGASELGQRLRRLETVTAVCGLFPLISIKGHAGVDEPGGADLGRRRAARVHELLRTASTGAAVIVETPPEPAGDGGRVTLDIRLIGGESR